MLPERFRVIRPYLAAHLQANQPLPSLFEVLYYLCKPGKQGRASRYIERVDETGDYRAITFKGFKRPFYYPKDCSWVDLCSTIDECFDPRNWHHYITEQTPVGANDVVVDCGAAEGLFTFICAQQASKVFAFEPLPKFVSALNKNFEGSSNVALYPWALGYKEQKAGLTDNEIFSAISPQGPIEIEIKTLDGTLLSSSEPITFLKADVEGFEFQLLLGAEELLRRYRPKIAITVYHRTNNVLQIESFLKEVQPDYRFATKGISEHGGPVMLHAW
jgi:FkbM family methyltransferase